MAPMVSFQEAQVGARGHSLWARGLDGHRSRPQVSGDLGTPRLGPEQLRLNLGVTVSP